RVERDHAAGRIHRVIHNQMYGRVWSGVLHENIAGNILQITFSDVVQNTTLDHQRVAGPGYIDGAASVASEFVDGGDGGFEIVTRRVRDLEGLADGAALDGEGAEICLAKMDHRWR